MIVTHDRMNMDTAQVLLRPNDVRTVVMEGEARAVIAILGAVTDLSDGARLQSRRGIG